MWYTHFTIVCRVHRVEPFSIINALTLTDMSHEPGRHCYLLREPSQRSISMQTKKETQLFKERKPPAVHTPPHQL